MTDASETDTTFVDSLPQLLCREVRKLLAPLTRIAADPDELDRLLASVGASPSDMQRTGLMSSITTVAGLVAQLEALSAQSELTFDSIEQILSLGQQAFAAVRAIDTVVVASPELAGLGQDVAERLFGNYLSRSHPLLRSIGALTTVIEDSGAIAPRERVIRNNAVVREAFTLDRFRFDRIGRLIRDPLTLLKEEYGASIATTAEATALAQKLFPRLKAFFDAVGLTSRFGFNSGDEDAAPPFIDSLTVHITDVLLGAEADAGVTIVLSPLEQGDLGLVVVPFGALNLNRTFGEWQFAIAVTAGMSTFAYGPQGLMVLDAAATATVGATASALLPPAESGPRFVLGSATGTRLEIGSVEFKAASSFAPERYSLAFDVSASKSAFVIAPGDGDGFLRSILPAEGLQAKFDLGLAWSNERGLTLRGSAGLDATLLIGLSIGGVVTVSTVHVSLHAGDADLLAEVSASMGVSIGPVDAVIERVGIAAAVTFPEDGGNLGVVNLDPHFKPPTGLGLSIDAQVVTGAGFLAFYPDRGEYLGAAQLRIKDKIQVKAIGLILTKPELSFLLLVSAEFPPVQLGLGFKLNGVGGLAGIHRGINEERLFAGLRDNTLDDLLFPEDPLKDIHGLIGKLNGVFPPAQDRYTFGLMGLITWGPHDLVTIQLGLIVEFPTALRLVVVGTLKAAVTKTIQGQEVSILRLQVNFAGLIDFNEQFIRFDAALYQSTLLGLALEGEMALRLKYGANPDFVVTLGGFHPDFQPPALRLPAELRRLQITLRAGNPHIWIDAYLAVTANTFQFGAGGHLRFSKWGVRVSGDLGFDALFQFSPFRFEAGVYFRLSASWKGHEFASIEIEGVFSGPSPWRIRGQFKLKICWFLKISVSFDASWGDDDPTLLGLVDVLALLVEDLRAPANWERTPGRTRLLVTARQSLHVNQNGAADLWLHPNDLLTVRQNTVPLGLPIDKFSEKRPQGASRFTVALQAADGTPDDKMLSGTPVKNHFAPGQFFHRSDEEKLHAKSYELFDAGATFEGLDSVRFEAWSGQEVAYEIDYVDDLAVEPKPPPEQPEPLQAESQQDFDIAVRNNTLANSAMARRARPRVASTADQITEQYVVANQATLAIHENMITDSETKARLLLRDLVRQDPRKARELTVLLRAETP